MTQKEKTVFKMMSSYIQKMGCESAEMMGEYWDDELFSDRYFNCKGGGTYKFPFDPSEVINNWIDSLDLDIRSYEDEGLNSVWLEINPKDNSISVIAGFSEMELGEEQLIVNTLSDKLNVEELKKELEKEFGDFKYIEVQFNGYGDSGGLEGIKVDGRDYGSDRIPSLLDDVLYGMLSQFGGWEIDSGSEGFFDIDLENDKVVLHFHWNEQVDRPETLHRAEIDE
jgi:hypothetical protein